MRDAPRAALASIADERPHISIRRLCETMHTIYRRAARTILDLAGAGWVEATGARAGKTRAQVIYRITNQGLRELRTTAQC